MRNGPAEEPQRSAGSVPGVRQATAAHSADVIGMARCAFPLESMRTERSASPAPKRWPERDVQGRMRATMPMKGTARLVPARSSSGASPMVTEA